MKNHLEIILLIAAVAAGIIFAPIIAPIYWDELPQYAIGQYSFNQYASLFDSIFGTSLADPAYADFEHFQDRDYGPVFEVFLIALGKVAKIFMPGFGWDDLIIMRHIAVYLVFVLGTCGVYSIARRRLESRIGGGLAAALYRRGACRCPVFPLTEAFRQRLLQQQGHCLSFLFRTFGKLRSYCRR